MTTLLKVERLSVEIPTAAGVLHPVRDVSFNVDRGEFLCVVGESGCGKTLTSLALMGLLPRKAKRRAQVLKLGEENLLSSDARRMGRIRGNRMAMIFQDPMTSLNPVYTIGSQLTEVYLRHKGGTRTAARARAVDLLDKVGIPMPERRLDQFPHQLSGGLRQRVMIAIALMCNPELLIADEPTTALDVTIQAQVLFLLRRLQRELGLTVILITHDLGVVARIADRVVVMYAGEVVEAAPVAELFGQPCHPYTQGLLRCLPGQGDAERLGTIPGMVPSLIGELQSCAFADRCSHVFDECRRQPIPFYDAQSPEHLYHCLLSPEATLRIPQEQDS